MKIPVAVSDMLYIPVVPELQDMYSMLRAKFEHKNPEFYARRAQGRYTGNTPRHIKTWVNVAHPNYGHCMAIQRGGTQTLRKIAKEFEVDISWVDQRHSCAPIDYLHNDLELWPEQQKLADLMFRHENCIIRSPTGSGKCLAPETTVLLYDGRVIRADKVVQGDLLMGPDSKPRTILTTTRGHGPMYKIKPLKGNEWCCNDQHILTLINTSSGKTIDISVEEYLTKSNWFKHMHKLFMVGVDFPIRADLILDPYFLGIWLGDGGKSLSFVEISKNDPEIKQAMIQVAAEHGLFVETYEHPNKCDAHRISGSGKTNRVLNKLRVLMQDGIRIPPSYLRCASRKDRLELLAGLLDTDGYLARGYFEIITKYPLLSDDIQFLAHSLGFRTTYKEKPVDGVIYHRINILGEISNIPTRIHRKQAPIRKINKDACRVGFKIEYIGQGNYVGWTLDNDGRFLLGDFTVTHNTELMLKVAEWMLKNAGPVLIIVWEGNRQSGLFKQWVDRIKDRFGIPEKEIGMIGDGVKRVCPLTVGMQQTLKNVGRKYIFDFGGVICDEIQRFAAPTFQKVVAIYPARYRFGVSADEKRKDGKEFLIYDVFGKPIAEIEKSSLIDKGKIHAVTIRIVPTDFDLVYEIEGQRPISWAALPSEKKNFNELLDYMIDDVDRNDLIWEYLYPCLEAGFTIMVATRRVDHAKYWDKRIRDAGFTSGLMLGGKSRAEEFATTKESLLTRKINAGVGTIQKIGVGHDIPSWDRGFVLTPLAGNKQVFEQMVGRLRRTCPGKEDAALYYFWDNKLYSSHKNKLARIYKHTQIMVDGEWLEA